MTGTVSDNIRICRMLGHERGPFINITFYRASNEETVEMFQAVREMFPDADMSSMPAISTGLVYDQINIWGLTPDDFLIFKLTWGFKTYHIQPPSAGVY